MTTHLLSKGYKKIAFIAGPESNFDAYERLRGFNFCLSREIGVESTIFKGEFTENSGVIAGQAIITSNQSFDAVFAANDAMAVGALHAFQQVNWCVPKDIAVVGFDNIPCAHFIQPALTTMQVDIAELGRQAFNMLLQLLEQLSKNILPNQRILQTIMPQLVIRSSCENL